MRPMGPVLAALVLAGALAAAAPTGAQGDGQVLYEIPDPRGDVEPAVLGIGTGVTPTAPATAVTDPFDITALRILEDEPDRLVIALEVADMDAAGATARDTLFGGLSGHSYTISFSLAGTDVQYRIIPLFTGSSGDCDTALVAGCEHATVPQLCIQTNQSSCFRQAVYGEVRLEENLYVFHVPKASLLGRGPADLYYSSGDPPDALPKNLPAGTALQGWRAEVRTFYTFDQAPDAGEGQPYRLATPTANTHLAVALDGEEEEPYYDPYASPFDAHDGVPSVGAAPGVPTVVPLSVENRADAKRMVNLTVEFIAGDAAKWSGQIVPTLAVPGGEERSVNLIINASAAVEHGETATILVHGKALGHPQEIGVLRLHLEGSVPPSPEQPRLYFHAAGGQTMEESIFFGGSQTETWINTREDDPAATSDAEGFTGQLQAPLFGSIWQNYFPLDTPLVQDLVFDTDKPVEANAVFSSRLPYQAEVTLRLFAGGIFLGSASQSATIEAAPTDVPLVFLMAEENRRVAASEGRLEAYLAVRSTEAGKSGIGDTFKMHPAGSFIDLPLVEDPNATAAQVSLGPVRIGLQYKGDGNPEEFVNPNRTKLYELVLVNEGVTKETARLNLTFVDDKGWEVSVAPSLRYRLAPGESVTAGVFVYAPSHAEEGDQFRVHVAAESIKDNVTRAQLVLVTIATTGVDIPDEKDSFHADNETLEKAVSDDGGDSPGLGLAAIMATMAAACAWRRRRGPGKTI